MLQDFTSITIHCACACTGSLLLSITTPPDQSEAVAQVLGKMYPSASQRKLRGGNRGCGTEFQTSTKRAKARGLDMYHGKDQVACGGRFY
eukprot:1156585-Pelagomonas_calceolata.AAC.9